MFGSVAGGDSENLTLGGVRVFDIDPTAPRELLLRNATSVWPGVSSPTGNVSGTRLDATMYLGTQLIKYVLPLIIFIGTVGNILSLIVLQRKAMRTTCSSVYLSALAIADVSVLYLSGFKTWLRVATGFELLHVADSACKLIKYAFYSCTHFSAWIVVVITFERLLVVYTPFRASTLWLVRRPHLTTFVSGVVVMLFNVNIIWTSELVYDSEGGPPTCASYSYENFICDIFPKINLLVYSVLPSILVFTFNIVIIAVIIRSTSPPEGTVSPPNNFRRHGHQQRLTMTLLTLSTLWLVLSLPYSIIDSHVTILLRVRVPGLVRVICFMMMYLNHSVNFYVYCLLGQKFRTELKRTFGFKTYNKFARNGHSQKIVVQAKKKKNALPLSKMSIDNLYN